jgi:hypothetical protein
LKAKLLILLLGVSACHSTRQLPVSNTASTPGPPVLVYKTKADYFNLVPVMLNEAKTRIVSYPDPKDVKTSQGYLVPIRLKQGYLLDKKGIGLHVAFLNITYEDYSRLKNAPTPEEMEKLIIDRDPLLELCDCGHFTQYTDPVNQLNRYIKRHSLHTICKTLK